MAKSCEESHSLFEGSCEINNFAVGTLGQAVGFRQCATRSNVAIKKGLGLHPVGPEEVQGRVNH